MRQGSLSGKEACRAQILHNNFEIMSDKSDDVGGRDLNFWDGHKVEMHGINASKLRTNATIIVGSKRVHTRCSYATMRII